MKKINLCKLLLLLVEASNRYRNRGFFVKFYVLIINPNCVHSITE
ncbi:MAG: hypothetical protein K0R34_2185 [Herbinix sp.]|jgi:hypothetical protein|nr:hypothetical protein [Herbinix sp.]